MFKQCLIIFMYHYINQLDPGWVPMVHFHYSYFIPFAIYCVGEGRASNRPDCSLGLDFKIFVMTCKQSTAQPLDYQ